MTLEATPLSVASDGNLRIAAVPTGSDPTSVAVLAATTTKLITYSLTSDGWNRAKTENTVTDDRLSNKQSFARPGTATETLEVTYVYGDTNDVAKTVLIEGTTLQFVDRRSVPNATEWATGQKVDIITAICGAQRKNAPAKDGTQTISQTMFIIATTRTDVALVA